MNKLKTVICFGLSLASLAALSGRADSGDDMDISPRPNFNLFISNQSFVMSNVDITISIDNVTVVNDRFPVGDQHLWRGFPITLSNGVHTLMAVTQTGQADLQTEFMVTSNHSAILSFWCVPDKSADGDAITPSYFIFKMNERLLID